MAISFIGAGAVQVGSNPTVPVPTGYAAGDYLIIFSTSGLNNTVPSGWTTIQSTTSQIMCCYKVATASESSVVMTVSNTSSETVMLCYRGVSSFDLVSTVNTTTGTTLATNTITTTASNDLVISYYSSNTVSTGTWTAPASTTSRVSIGQSGANRGILIVDEIQIAAGISTARTATNSASAGLWSLAFALKPTVAINTSNFFRMF